MIRKDYILTNHAKSRMKERNISEKELISNRMEEKMKISFDRKADASYIKLSNKKISKTVPVSDYCNADLDSEGKVVGIELLFISQYMDDFKLWLDITDTAQYLDKSPVTLRRWVQEKKIPYYKIGREYLFIKEDLDEYIRKQRRS